MFRNIEMSFEESQKKKSWFINESFSVISNKDNHDHLVAALKIEKTSERIKVISKILDCDKESVCLIYRKKAIVNGVKNVNIICTMSMYNKDFASFLKGIENYYFYTDSSMWRVPENEENKNKISGYLRDHFDVVVDCETVNAFKNNHDAEKVSNPDSFITLPYHVKFKFEDLYDSIFLFKNHDYDRITSIGLFDGESFEDISEMKDEFWTQSPFLLFRYRVERGQPRYAVYSTIGKFIERIVFHNDKMKSYKVIAKFKEKFDKSGSIFIKPDDVKRINKSKKSLMKIKDEFSNYRREEDIVNSALNDCYGFPLSSKYIDIDVYTGEEEALFAYAKSDQRHVHMTKNIATHLGYKGDHKYFMPVVFNSDNMDIIDEEEFLITMVHEMAHHIVSFGRDEFFSDVDIRYSQAGHGFSWILSNNILMSLVQGMAVKTTYENHQYEVFEGETIGHFADEIDSVVEGIFNEIENEIGSGESCSFEYFCGKVREGLIELNNMLELDD